MNKVGTAISIVMALVGTAVVVVGLLHQFWMMAVCGASIAALSVYAAVKGYIKK